MNTSRKFTTISIIVLFCGAIFSPLIGAFIQEDRSISSTEKRTLAQLPPLPSSRKMLLQYPRELERYFNDQFGMRRFFLHSFSRIKTFIGDTEINRAGPTMPTENTIKGKNGWFFLNRAADGDPVSDYRNISLYSEIDLQKATLIYAARNDWLKRRGIRYLLMIAPNKHTIYSEYLPDYVVKQGNISSMDQLFDSLSRYTSVDFIDLRPPLLAGKKQAPRYWKDHKEEAALYYKQDSHWNGAGADIVQYEIARHLERIFPGRIVPQQRPPEDFVMSRFTGDISLVMGRDDNAAYGPAVFSGTCSNLKAREYKQKEQIATCRTGQLNALIFHDSFFTLPLKIFVADYLATTTFRWERMSQAALLAQLKKKKIDIVIEERSERYLPLIPDIRSELYNGFWARHFQQWKEMIFTLDARLAASGSQQYSSHNLRLEPGSDKNTLIMHAATDDPMLTINDIPFKADHLYMLRVEIDSPANGRLQIFLSSLDPAEKFPSEKHVETYQLKKGANVLYIPLFSGKLGKRLRFDPGNRRGEYLLKKFSIRQVDPSSLKQPD